MQMQLLSGVFIIVIAVLVSLESHAEFE